MFNFNSNARQKSWGGVGSYPQLVTGITNEKRDTTNKIEQTQSRDRNNFRLLPKNSAVLENSFITDLWVRLTKLIRLKEI